MSLYRKDEVFTPKPTPFGGLIDGVPAVTGPHLLVSGPSGVGKALALSTLIPTPDGFTRMAALTVGDTVFGRDGKPCTVTDVWDVIEQPELYRLTFSTGHDLRADAGHQWTVLDTRRHDGTEVVVTTADMLASPDAKWIIKPPVLPDNTTSTTASIYVVDIEPIGPGHPDYEPARCIAVDAPDAVFLAGEGFIPTHNSRRVLGPGILRWQGPVVAISSKPDLIDLCLEKRLDFGGRDHTYVLDLSGEVPDEVLPDGAEKVTLDPVALITSDDEAVDMAGLLMKAGSAGASGLATGSSSPEGAMWETLSNPPLAGILRAAAADGVMWARAAVGRVNPPESDPDAPCWTAATRRLEAMKSDLLAEEILQASLLPEKMLSSVMITMKQGLAPWTRSTVAGKEGTKVFTPSLLEHPRATLFMVAPASGVAAGAAVAAVDAISNWWRKSQTAPTPLPYLLFGVDELCNTLPWAKLPIVVTEARAMGIAILVCLQATSQLARRYGSDGMTELREVFPAILCLTGAPEKEILEKAAWAHGRTEAVKMSRDHEGKRSASTEIGDMLHGSDLLPHDIDHGRLLRGARPADAASPRVREAGLLVELPDISTLRFRTRTKSS